MECKTIFGWYSAALFQTAQIIRSRRNRPPHTGIMPAEKRAFMKYRKWRFAQEMHMNDITLDGCCTLLGYCEKPPTPPTPRKMTKMLTESVRLFRQAWPYYKYRDDLLATDIPARTVHQSNSNAFATSMFPPIISFKLFCFALLHTFPFFFL